MTKDASFNSKVVLRATFFGIKAILACVVVVLLLVLLSRQVRLSPVLTGSMHPGIQSGDLVVLQKVSSSQLEVGDVIVVNNPLDNDAPVMHRVMNLKIEDSSVVVVTKGDANNAPDRWTPLALGETTFKNVEVVANVGYVWIKLGEPLFRSAMIAVILLILGFSLFTKRPAPQLRASVAPADLIRGFTSKDTVAGTEPKITESAS